MVNSPLEIQARKDNEEAFFLIQTAEWKQYVAFLKRRAIKLQGYVNDAVKKGDLLDAQVQLALMEDGQRQIAAFIQQTVQTKQGLNKKENSQNGK